MLLHFEGKGIALQERLQSYLEVVEIRYQKLILSSVDRKLLVLMQRQM